MSRRFECRLEVRSYELDSFGHVNNAVFLNYLEAAREDYLKQVGLSFDDFQRWGAFPVVRRASLEFLSPLRANDRIIIAGEMTPLRRTGFRAHQVILQADTEARVLDATLELVFTDRAGRPIAVPRAFREGLLELAEG